jgi:hypothetical protein
MDVSNTTGEDTQYRVANGVAKLAANWQPLPRGSSLQCCSKIEAPWTIEFRLPNGTVLSATFNHPKGGVELVKTGNHYSIKADKAAA